MQLLDLQVDFLRPFWRRVVLVAVCLIWSVFEFVTAAPFWGVIFGGLGVYALWQLFFDGWPENGRSGHDRSENGRPQEDGRQQNTTRESNSSNVSGD